MLFHHIRNATSVVDYAGTRFLIDPMLAPKDHYPAFPGTHNDHLRNPTVELKTPLAEITAVDAVIVTHDHLDHWDPVAQQKLDKSLPIFVKNVADQTTIQDAGFTDVRLLGGGIEFNGITLTPTGGQHGSDEIMASPLGAIMGEVCGVVFQHAAEKTLYLAGDTLWNHHVKDVLRQYHPQVVVLNAGAAKATGFGAIIMDKEDVRQVHRHVDADAQLIAVHMEAVNHVTLTRDALRDFAVQNGLSDRLLIPVDGERYHL